MINEFPEKKTLNYLIRDLQRYNIPSPEFISLYQKLETLPELQELELILIHQRPNYDKLDYITPTGNIHFTGSYDSALGSLEEITRLISRKTGLVFDPPQHWTGQANRGSLLYHFKDGENIARLVLTSYSTD